MAAPSSSDPFYVVKEEVNDTLKTAERKYRQCKVSGSATVLEELKDDVEGLRYMLQEIKRSVDTASKNPNRFRLTNAEIHDRKAWMDHVGQRVEQLSSNIWTISQRSRVSPYGETRDVENDRFIETEMSHQEQIVARQDQDLDVLGDHVLRIGELGREMGQELDVQGQLLDDFGYEMQGTQTRLAAAQRKVQALNKTSFVAAAPVRAKASTVTSTNRRSLRLTVVAAKGKQRMRRGQGNSGMAMPSVPTPPVDPDNVEFVIFVRSKKLLQWMPLSVMKGGGPANMLVKAMENDLGKKMYGNTLVENVGNAIYKDKDAIERSIRAQFPMFKATQEFEYGFKIRDKEDPKSWYLAKDIQVIPPASELGNTPIDKVNSFFQDMGKNLGLGN
ncbi:Protein HHL1 [Picochlorum sp. SENEW3]|nr:Protein HHL1 [Picochlorum sp. SENEW3]WPT15832.1 Protein HHL1 [Picochlorum sp. SENEW3]